MSKFQPANMVPIFGELKLSLKKLRDQLVVPMRDNVKEIRDQMLVEKQRLLDEQAAAQPVNTVPIAPSAGDSEPTP